MSVWEGLCYYSLVMSQTLHILKKYPPKFLDSLIQKASLQKGCEPTWRKVDSKQQRIGLIVQSLQHLELVSLPPLHNFSSSSQDIKEWILSKGENRVPKRNRSPFMGMNALKYFLHSPIQKLSKKGRFSHPHGNHHSEGLMQHPKKTMISKLNSLSYRRDFVFFSCWT